MFIDKAERWNICVCSKNGVVDIVLMTGLRHAFNGNRRYASRASRLGGTYMLVERRDKVVTVIEDTRLVSVTAPSRRMTGNRLECDLLTL